jgi:hypothetical protein
MASLDYAFPATDSATVKTLGSLGGTVNQSNITTQINKAETDQLFESLNSSEQNSNTALTYGAYLGRNMTIRNIASDLTKENKRVNNGAKDTYTRQSEINEWSAQNKMDTLFFLQILFIYFSVIVVCLFLRQYGLMPNAGLYIVIGLGLLIVIGILWNRASYTQYNRDKRFWNRRFVGLDDANLSAKLQCAMSTTS